MFAGTSRRSRSSIKPWKCTIDSSSSTDRNVLVTGATGFIGRNLVPALARSRSVRVAVRSRNPASPPTVDQRQIDDLESFDAWDDVVSEMDEVVHLAADVTPARASKVRTRQWAVNVDATVRMARAAARAGTGHFVFTSTIKVTQRIGKGPRRWWQVPSSSYAESKLEAEERLLNIGRDTGMRITILRPPPIYGPGAHGMFLFLTKAIEKGLPLPVASLKHTRAVLYIGNLVSCIEHLLDHPPPQGPPVALADGPAPSLPELAMAIGEAMGRPAKLLSVPPRLVRGAALLVGGRSLLERFVETVEVDTEAMTARLGWYPPYSMKEGLERTLSPRQEDQGDVRESRTES